VAVKPENTFIASVNRHLKTTYFEKTNNPFRSGIADVWYSGKQGDLWVEYKYAPSLPKTQLYRPDLSARQIKWLGDRYDEGRNVAVILGLPQGGVVYLHREWEAWALPARLHELTRSRPELAEWIYQQVGYSPCKSSGRSSEPPQ
jgi:hypothetical protein